MTNPTNEHRELKPCPFCGGTAILGMFNVWCAKCRAATDKDVDAEADGIIRRWNKRPALSSRDAEVREVLEGLATEVVGHGLCWCPSPQYAANSGEHTDRCRVTRDLYSKLQATELQEENKS